MRKLKKNEEVPHFEGRGCRMNQEVYKLLTSLVSGERCVIEKKDWQGTTPFTHTIFNATRLRGKFSVRRLTDATGWLVTRK